MIIKTYINHLKSSLTSINHYSNVLKRPIFDSFLFFFISILLFGTVSGIKTAIIELPETKTISETTLSELVTNYPEDLTISWSGSELTVNRDNLVVDYPKNFNPAKYDLPEKLVYFSNNTTHPNETNINQIPLIYLSTDTLYINSPEENVWSTHPLKLTFNDADSFQVTKTVLIPIIDRLVESISENFKYIQLFTAAIVTLLYLLSSFWFVLLESIFVFFLIRLYNLHLKFKQVVNISLNIVVPASLLSIISNVIYPTINFPMRTITFWTILMFVILNIKRNKTTI